MGNWNAFEIDKPFVIENFKKGFFDYIEIANNVTETKFFKWLIGEEHLQRLAKTYPTPRKKEEIPLWVYLSAELTLKFHAAPGFSALPYILHCGGLKDALGPKQAKTIKDQQEDAYRIECEGYNNKNIYSRETPCDQDFVRKLAKDTSEKELEQWFGHALPELYKSVNAFDNEGIFLVDGSYLFVPNNEKYEDSAVLRFDSSNHPVSEKQYEALTPTQQKGCCYRRCYRTVNLLHTNPAKSYYLYCGMRIFNGAESEVPKLRPLVEDFVTGPGKGKVKWLIFDRGFIDGKTISFLKEKHHIDSVFPLKKSMTIYDDAKRLAELDPDPPVVWKPPAKKEPELSNKPETVKKREKARRKTIKNKKQKQGKEKPELKEVHLRLVSDNTLWESCKVPIQIAIINEIYTDGTESKWLLATTAEDIDPVKLRNLYHVRPTIEERFRQLKLFWDLTNFRSPGFSLVVNQIVFVLLAYSLMQIFLLRIEKEELNKSTRKRLLEQLLPMGDKVFLYYKNRATNLNLLEHQELLLNLSEGARRRILGKTRRLRKSLIR